VAEVVYMLHMQNADGKVWHYIGSTRRDLMVRLAEHGKGWVKSTGRCIRGGGIAVLVAAWEGGVSKERELKALWRDRPSLCSVCTHGWPKLVIDDAPVR